jgi:hypothetical protein
MASTFGWVIRANLCRGHEIREMAFITGQCRSLKYSDAGDRFILFSFETPSFHHVETSLEAIGGGVFSDGLRSGLHDATTGPSRLLEHQLNPRQRTGRDWPHKATTRPSGLLSRAGAG